MQRALKQYRQAQDRGDQGAVDEAHGEVQDTVLTLYDLLRPHIKHNDAVSEYWDGEPPRYPGGGQSPDPEDGKAVLQVQVHNNTVSLEGVTPPEEQTLDAWHDALDLNGSVRLQALQPTDDGVLVQLQMYELGLRQLDDWKTEFETVQTDLGGFMGGTKTPQTERKRVDMSRLRRAANELGDVVEKLGLHARVDADDLVVDEL